ncbi:hypothetical protein CC86DRAFT_400421 [Ophiobolus disseminans]|uniref:Uncharacterized protein n=1 Tax=Ophiobolus disseminans TaxID=1469910 RepID=A0A6A7AKP5_9PLEO|nr:hypothetical protein CC86DRAFT_400421 [Ophiobolus disseminans]
MPVPRPSFTFRTNIPPDTPDAADEINKLLDSTLCKFNDTPIRVLEDDDVLENATCLVIKKWLATGDPDFQNMVLKDDDLPLDDKTFENFPEHFRKDGSLDAFLAEMPVTLVHGVFEFDRSYNLSSLPFTHGEEMSCQMEGENVPGLEMISDVKLIPDLGFREPPIDAEDKFVMEQYGDRASTKAMIAKASLFGFLCDKKFFLISSYNAS